MRKSTSEEIRARFDADEMLGKVLSESPFRPIDPERSAARMEIQRRQGYIAAEVMRYRKDGSDLPLWVTASNVFAIYPPIDMN